MSWGKLDDSMAFHRKVLAAGNEAVGAWARMISQSCCELTDGRIARATALAIASPKTLKRLVDVGLLEQLAEGDYQIHDFLDWNPTGAEVKERRETDRVRKEETRRRQGRDSQGRMTPARSPEIVQSDIRSDVRADSSQNPEGVTPLPYPYPSRTQREIPPTPQGGQDETPVSKPPESPREQDYQAAYESGVSEALGREWAMPRNQRGELHQALLTFAKDPRTGEKLRGERILRWLRFQGKELVRVVHESGEDPKFWSSFGPRGMLRMLNEVPVAEPRRPELESGVIKLPSGLFDPRKVSGE